jgi:thioesterase domain-containing protein
MDDGLEIYLHALQDYTPTGFSGRITLFLAKGSIIRWTNAAARWKRHARREIEIVQVAGAHHNFFREPHTGPLAEAITGVLNLGR